GITEAAAQQMLYTGGFTIEATVNPKVQAQMEELMLNTGDAYFPAGWHEEPVSSLSEDDIPVYNDDGTLKTTTAEDGTVTYYRNVRTQAAMVTLDYDGNVIADRKSTRLNSSHVSISYAVFCLKKKKKNYTE